MTAIRLRPMQTQLLQNITSLNVLHVVQFTEDVGRGIVDSWRPIVERRAGEAFGEQHRQWQLLRRGRYIEFNLLYDRCGQWP